MKKTLSILVVLAMMLAMTTMYVSAAAKGSIEFKEGELVVVDPKPDPKPGDPDPDPTPTPGDLGSLYPASLYFGIRNISPAGGTYDNIKVGSQLGGDPALPGKPYNVGIAVSDGRGSTKAEWHVKGTITGFKIGANPSLLGFEIDFTSVAGSLVEPATGMIATYGPEMKPFKLKADTPSAAFFNANTTAGSPGQWGANWKPALTTQPGQENAGANVADLTWTVTAGPVV